MTRLAYRFYRQLGWLRYWASRRFTPAGILVLVVLVISGSIGVDMDQSVGFEVFVLAFCLLAVSIGASRFFRGRFAVERDLPRFVTAGQPLSYTIRIRNQTHKLFHGIEWLEEFSDARPTLEEFAAGMRSARPGRSFRLRTAGTPLLDVRRANAKLISLPALPPGQEVAARADLLPLKRGPLRFTGVTVARPDPFGLWRAFVRIPMPQSLLVLPKRYSVPALTLAGTQRYQQGGVALASAIGESDEFVSLRDYRPGDPMRHIHWRSWARAGRPIVREFQDEFFVRHALILDTFAGLEKAAAFEEAVSVAASFACEIDTQESLLDLMFVGPRAVRFTTGRGLSHVEQALEILASVRACPEKPFHALRTLVMHHAGEVSGCICVFLDWDEARRKFVRELRASGLPVLVLAVADAPLAEKLRIEVKADRQENFHVLEVGKLAEDLAALGGMRL